MAAKISRLATLGTRIMTPEYKRIIIEEKTFTIKNLRSDLPATCAKCDLTDLPPEKFVLRVERGAGVETFFCLKCWEELSRAMSWTKIYCLIFFTEKGFSGTIEVGNLINRFLGNPFDALRASPGGFVLYSNSIKVEQPKLF